MKGELAKRVKESTRDLMRGLGFEMVDVKVARQGGRFFLRISIDSEGGVTIDDCARASALIDQVIERERLIDSGYVLEVMSPGINRQLKEPEEFMRSVGKRVKVNLCQPYEGRRSYAGILAGALENSFTLDRGDELLEFRYESLASARLDPELPW